MSAIDEKFLKTFGEVCSISLRLAQAIINNTK